MENNWKKLAWISNWSSYGTLDGVRFQSEERIEILFPDNTEKACVVKIDRKSYQGRGGMDESNDQNYPYVELDYNGIPTRLNLYDPKVMESCKARRIIKRNQMRVKDLIKELEKYNEELEIVLLNNDTNLRPLLLPCNTPKLIGAIPHPNLIQTEACTIYTPVYNKDESSVEFLLLT